ncbi:MAG: hypothetical protein ACTHNU_00145 [Gaiellales bacterium]
MFTRRLKAWAVTGAVAIAALTGVVGVANAASGGSPTGTTTFATTGAPKAPPGNPAAMTHGPGETLLTGSAASRAKAAALAAVPGATVIRVETDSAGAAYEAHMRKSDGTYVTVKLDAAFKVTAVQSGFGAGMAP